MISNTETNTVTNKMNMMIMIIEQNVNSRNPDKVEMRQLKKVGNGKERKIGGNKSFFYIKARLNRD